MKKFLFLLSFLVLIFPSFSRAAQFPNDAKGLSGFKAGSDTTGTIATVPDGHTWTVLEYCLNTGGHQANFYLTDNNFEYINFLYGSFVQSCSHLNSKLTAGNTITYRKPAGSWIAWNITYVDYDLSAVPEDSTYMTAINTKMDTLHTDITSANSKADDLYMFFTTGRFVSMMNFVLVGIYLFFSIMFIRWIYKMFFGHF